MMTVQALTEVFYAKYHCMLIQVRIRFSALDKDLYATATSFLSRHLDIEIV